MSLAHRIFKTFFVIFLVQLLVVFLWGASLYLSEDDLPLEVVNSLTKVDKSITEGMLLQHKIHNPLARDLLAYRLLELNVLDSAQFSEVLAIDALKLKLGLSDCELFGETQLCKKKNNPKLLMSLIPLMFGKNLEGYLILEKSLNHQEKISPQVVATIGFTLLGVFFLNALSLLILWSKFLKPETQKLMKVFEEQRPDPTLQVNEYIKIQDNFMHSLEKVKKTQSSNLQLQVEVAKSHLTSQVAHDIRSPLEVLKSLKSEMSALPSGAQERLKLSIERIEEIAYNLLKSLKDSDSQAEKSQMNLQILLRDILLEKRMEIRKYPNLEIVDESADHSYGRFSEVNVADIKSLLSNLINNAIEAMDYAGVVKVNLTSQGQRNLITVKDQGTGIPDEIAPKIFNRGFTTKDEIGNGLGLFQGKLAVQSWGGKLSFKNHLLPEKGASFIIELPEISAPDNFVPSLNLKNYQSIIILDDDPNFHELWKERFAGQSHKISHFYSISEILTLNPAINEKTLLLCDYELMDQNLNGLDFIQKMGHQKHSILVTARSGEKSIRERCQAEGVKLLPKQLVLDVPLNQDSKAFVLIDDEKLTHINWTHFCEKNDIKLHNFYTVQDFLEGYRGAPDSTYVFIDSYLGNGLRGEVESEKINKRGFSHIYLVTGLEPSVLDCPDWIRGIYGKSPEEAFKKSLS